MIALVAVVRAELRAYLDSGWIPWFLGLFLVATQVSFFSIHRFFARNVVDVAPLFASLPVLLIALVSALAMRTWAEGRRTGTLELAMTLPIGTAHWVLGKFLAGLLVVAVALGCTLPIVLSVATLGPLDWGPVAGGYLAALLLAGVYLSVGLCASSRTNNQLVALLSSLLFGGALLAIGRPEVTALVDVTTAEVFRHLGTGSRFQSMERGVLDMRDLAYCLGLIAFFLCANAYFLEYERLDTRAKVGARQSRVLGVGLVLVGLNVAALTAWLAPMTWLRIDLTNDQRYTLGPVTQNTLAEVADPMVIRGFFSSNAHPSLAPLIPQLRDLLTEYQALAPPQVRITTEDPSSHPELADEIEEQFGIKPMPMVVYGRAERRVVSTWFHVLVQQGNHYQLLTPDDLLYDRDGQFELAHPEYTLSRAIHKVSQGFQSSYNVFERLDAKAELTLYSSPYAHERAQLLHSVGQRLARQSGGRLSFRAVVVDPVADPALASRLLWQHGIRPTPSDHGDATYLHFLLRVGDYQAVIAPQDRWSGPKTRQALLSAIRRTQPGQPVRVGLVTPPRLKTEGPHQGPVYSTTEAMLRRDYQVERVDLSDGNPPDYLNVLVVTNPTEITPDQLFALDQYLRHGGMVVAFAGYSVTLGRLGWQSHPPAAGYLALLERFGVRVIDTLVADRHLARVPIPMRRWQNNVLHRRVGWAPYALFADVSGSGLAAKHPALAHLRTLLVPWASPLAPTDAAQFRATPLVRTSKDSWRVTPQAVQPDIEAYPGTGVPPGIPSGPETVVLAVDPPQNASPGPHSAPQGRLVVIGSPEFASDFVLSLTTRPELGYRPDNAALMTQLIDWGVGDSRWLVARNHRLTPRLKRLSDEAKAKFEYTNYAFSLVLWLIALGYRPLRRYTTRGLT